ncbi:glycosyl hydrolase [Sulfuricurvum sp. RIFCSPLOWO2_12_FULL_43_24]|uniref:glycosyl hydrolase n=1 Tax=Sulfuricurvum sp. RIFCSPLOWO2_12_FULL_43_24 TaxID=1802247 RepID=UPI0008BA65AE|nr:glycosyl hydrolase [Sulfuricurvum sp. RIFCSPLOWO2_12_FULL_43_24]OHD88621.1 MAG: glycosyl hydrolase [Sulfuricurvum sp. RIFCSPLOWO2_12_FULL_43_24]
MKQPFAWDHYSDQPAIIRDRALKRQMRKSALPSLIKTFLIALITLPIALLLTPFTGRRAISGEHFFGLGVNLDKEPNTTPYLLNELGVKKLLIRIPLWEMDRLHEYVAFIRSLGGKEITVALLQDREHITSADMSRDHFIQIFEALEGVCTTYIIGSTINRAKWGFFSVYEYLDFYAVAYALKKTRFPHLKLIGSNVIDFEYHFSAHTLFNLSPIRFDAIGSLLYVDRRGAPENSQMGFNLMGKINLLSALISLSPKTSNELIITETNWPIQNTAPYAPTSEHECVSEEDYSDYMVRYHLLAFASQRVSCVYWHQLIAPGYGLIDNREGILRKRSAFEAYKVMLSHLSDAQFIDFNYRSDEYTLSCSTPRGELHITWTLNSSPIYTYKAQA